MSDTQNICSVINVSFHVEQEISRWFHLKDGSRPGHPKTVVTNANITAVAGLRLQTYNENIAQNVGI